jgi:hypothetical protein
MNISFLNRRQFIKTAGIGTLALATQSCSLFNVKSTSSANKAFSIVALPDTQYIAKDFPDIFMSQTKWVKDNAEALNVMCVVHEGDITDNNTEPEWQNADAAIDILDGSVPCCLNVGNHDMPGWGKERDVTVFNRYFPVERYKSQPWFGGVKPGGGLENAYYKFEQNGQAYLILCLEFGPLDDTLDWANDIISKHPKHNVIITSHCYMYFDDTRVGEGDQWNPHTYGVGGNDGEEMWEKLASRHKNVFLVLSGHILGDGLGRMTSTGAHGNKVEQILANYQMLPEGGQGWLRVMTIDPENKTIDVKTYSPWLNKYAADAQNQFVVNI